MYLIIYGDYVATTKKITPSEREGVKTGSTIIVSNNFRMNADGKTWSEIEPLVKEKQPQEVF